MPDGLVSETSVAASFTTRVWARLVGVEPTTRYLTGSRSAAELQTSNDVCSPDGI